MRNGATHNQHAVSAFGKTLLSSGAKGALGELLVSVDLTKKGYDVFRAIAPTSPFDLVVAKGDTLLRIECRCGIFHANTKTLSFSKTAPRTGAALPDHYAVVTAEGITYEPPLEESC